MAAFSDKSLRRLYLRFNRRYFAGKLPLDVDIFWHPLSDALGDCDKQEDGSFIIRLDPSISGFPTFTRITLLHEMCHISLWEVRCADHGRVFHRELLRVLSAGASYYL